MREDMRYVFTIRLQKTPDDVLSTFKDYWHQSSDNDSDSSGQQRRSSRHKNNTVWVPPDFLPGDNPNMRTVTHSRR